MRAIFFKAYYCGMCDQIWDEQIEPLLDEGFDIEEVDAMKRPAEAKRYGIRNIPALIALNGGERVGEVKGRAITSEAIRALMQN